MGMPQLTYFITKGPAMALFNTNTALYHSHSQNPAPLEGDDDDEYQEELNWPRRKRIRTTGGQTKKMMIILLLNILSLVFSRD